MVEKRQSIHGLWSSRWAFILAATGAAVGLGNIWKFPYMVGQNGGAAFVAIYLLSMVFIGIPLLMTEIALGRCGRQNPANTLSTIAQENNLKPAWRLVGMIIVCAGPAILIYYCVIAGWTLAYVVKATLGQFTGITAAEAKQLFETFIASPWQLLLYHSIVTFATIFVVAKGIEHGIEKVVNFMFPGMLFILAVLVGYGINSGHFQEAVVYLFQPDFSELTSQSFLLAMGQAFFSLSIATGSIIMYGAYLPRGTSVTGCAVTIALADTGVALLAGLAIFQEVIGNQLEPGMGPGLIFETLPIALGKMSWGNLFAFLFFVMLIFAAFTSTISLLEPGVAYLIETRKYSRIRAAIILGGIIWLFGIVTILSFNHWQELRLFGKNFFELLDYLTANLMLPIAGLLLVIFTGWRIKREFIRQELQLQDRFLFRCWYFVIRYIAPLSIIIVFLKSMGL